MKYKINAFILYDAVDGTLSLKEDERLMRCCFILFNTEVLFPEMRC